MRPIVITLISQMRVVAVKELRKRLNATGNAVSTADVEGEGEGEIMEYLVVDHLTTKDITRIFSRLEINKATGCWLWNGHHVTKQGHSVTRYSGGRDLVYRILYAWVFGPIPKGRGRDIPVLDHVICDDGRCCNPLHVELSTHYKNILRGKGKSAINSRKTHCPKGHELPSFKPRENRFCRICNRAWQSTDEQRAKKREWRNSSHWKEYRREWRRKRREAGVRPT